MSAFWVAPLGLAALALAWSVIQRCWVHQMRQPSDTDALARPGCGGAACGLGACAETRVQCIAAASSCPASAKEDSPP